VAGCIGGKRRREVRTRWWRERRELGVHCKRIAVTGRQYW
jgi:hypothetical protein